MDAKKFLTADITSNHRIITEYNELEETHKEVQLLAQCRTTQRVVPMYLRELSKDFSKTSLSPFQCPATLWGKKPFLNLPDLHIFPLDLVTGYHTEEISACRFALSHEEAEGLNEVLPQSPLVG